MNCCACPPSAGWLAHAPQDADDLGAHWPPDDGIAAFLSGALVMLKRPHLSIRGISRAPGQGMSPLQRLQRSRNRDITTPCSWPQPAEELSG